MTDQQGFDVELTKQDGSKPIMVSKNFFKNKLYKVIPHVDGSMEFYEVTNNYMQIPEDGMHSVSDGYHTFDELYDHRAALFSALCRSYPIFAWKSRKHHDGTEYEGMFIAGMNLPNGQVTYHYKNKWWDAFPNEIERAPEWDGHTPEDVIDRIGEFTAYTGFKVIK